MSQTGASIDRYIPSRRSINFLNYLPGPEDDSLLNGPQVTRKDIQQKNKCDLSRRVVSGHLGIRTGFRQTPRASRRKSLWDFRPRLSPGMEVTQMLETSVLSRHDLISQLASVSANGRFVAKYDHELTHSTTFFKDPSFLEAVKMPKNKLPRRDELLTAVWVHPEGEGILLGFHRGFINVLEEGKYIKSRYTFFCCPETCCAVDEKEFCNISHLDYHLSRCIIYWCCDHGVFGRYLNGQTIKHKIRRKNKAACMKLSPSGSYLAVSMLLAGVKVLNAFNMELVHHFQPTVSFGKAIDWHPWTSNLLATGVWDQDGTIDLWACHLQEPHVGQIKSHKINQGVFVLKFHPVTAELVYVRYQSGKGDDEVDDLDFERGETTLVVLNGYGEIVDCSDPQPGLVTNIFWGPGGTQMLIGSCVDTLLTYKFIDRAAPRNRQKDAPTRHTSGILDLYNMNIR